MIPQFGEVFGEPIPAYFAMLMTGFAVAIGLGVVWAKRSRFDHDVVIDLGLGCLIAGVAGARILHVFVDGQLANYIYLCTDPTKVAWEITQGQCAQAGLVWDAAASVCRETEGDCFRWAKFWQGGLVWYGGLLGAGVYGTHFLWKENYPTLKGLDMAGMSIPLGVFFGRLGCWFGGCCFGPDSTHWSAVSFPAYSSASESQWRVGLLESPSLPSHTVLPAQLHEAAALLAITAFVMLWLHPRKRFDGQVFAVSMALYAVARFVLEFFRADERGAFLGVSTSQWIGLVIVAGMAVTYVRFQRYAQQKMSVAFVGPEHPPFEKRSKKKRAREEEEE